jgi:hypothetical protein
MFRVRFLGHQGWLLSTDTTNVLVDPLLTERFGHGGSLGRMYPPRHVDVSAFPPIDAVVITHEHDDHFDIPSLHRLDRRIPVLLSERSSIAARTILQEMGFRVEPIVADDSRAIGDLRWHAFAADHRGGDADEWDVLPVLARDTTGHGSFMSSVDVRPTPRMLGALPALAPPGVWAYANNLTATSFQQIGPPSGVDAQGDVAALVRVVLARHAEVAEAWGEPLATLVCGGGFAFPDDRRVLDHHVFPASAHELATRMNADRPSARALAAVPGHGVALEHGHIAAHLEPEPFISALPRVQWPDRMHRGDTLRLEDYAPACGRTALDDRELHELLAALHDFARFLYGRPVYRALASLSARATQGRRPQLGLALGIDGSRRVLALVHDAPACRFTRLHDVDPVTELVCGLECWASDLLALLRGEIGPTALCYAGRLRVWNAMPELVRVSPHELWMFAHPLRRPEAAIRLYRHLLDREPSEVPRVPAAR